VGRNEFILEIFNQMKILKSIFIIACTLSLATMATHASFNDQVASAGNHFSTGNSWGHIVINEVYYDVACNKGDDPFDEWLELYNPTDQAISLKDWAITDNHTTRTIHSNKSIPAHGYALISKSASTWHDWNINPGHTPGVEIIELGQLIGNGLDNNGDRVILKSRDGIIIDQMNYGNDHAIWNPAAPDVARGHSLSRNPVGYDTDQAGDFIDNCLPSPGSSSVNQNCH
jgi:predicted ribosomally synthesized peptide with SipW-like signal peptide